MHLFGGRVLAITLFKRVIHTSVSLLNLYTILSAISIPYNVPEKHLKHELMLHVWSFRWYLLSLWVAAFQITYFSIYSAIDIVDIYGRSYNKIKGYLHSIGSYLLFTIVFPLSLLISILFWSIYLWDREVIYPTECDDFIPPVFNHVLHTTPVPLTIIYMLISNKKEPPINLTLPGLMAFMSIYCYFIFNLRVTKGIWVYMFLHKINYSQLQLVIFFSITAPFVFFMLGYKLHSLKKDLSKHLPSILLSHN